MITTAYITLTLRGPKTEREARLEGRKALPKLTGLACTAAGCRQQSHNGDWVLIYEFEVEDDE